MNIVKTINTGILAVVTCIYLVLGIILDILAKLVALILSVLVGIYVSLVSPFLKSMPKKQWIKDLAELGGNWNWNEENWYFTHFFCGDLF